MKGTTVRKALVTGGAGFIGSAVVRHVVGELGWNVTVVDKLTYAGHQGSLDSLRSHPGFRLIVADICDAPTMAEVFSACDPDVVMHLAAETHVDRSIDQPAEFIGTNIVGTYTLLEAALAHWRGLTRNRAQSFRFLHVSTDEVYGALGAEGSFRETTAYDPRSPYSASKAAADHLVRAWGHTYGLPVVVSNCSNNYGSHQSPEKLIPLMIIKGLAGEPLPVYGKGQHVRDWLFVDDNARALAMLAEHGRPGETYNVAGGAERRNIDVVSAICDSLDLLAPRDRSRSRHDLITFVADRPGHDYRYCSDFTKIQSEFGWTPQVSFEAGLMRTVQWYLTNRHWWEPLTREQHTLSRRGLGRASQQVRCVQAGAPSC
jgi:dTDP-glucose 4,6-dehydratase